MSKKKKKKLDLQIKNNKKDTCGLFTGKFKSVEIESKKFKKDKYKKKNISDKKLLD